MIRKLLITALLPFSITAHAENRNKYDSALETARPVTEAVSKEITSFSDAFVRHALKGTRYEQVMQEHKLKQDKQTLRVTRSVKDCIKPGDLIDDEVQMCVNGTREKTW